MQEDVIFYSTLKNSGIIEADSYNISDANPYKTIFLNFYNSLNSVKKILLIPELLALSRTGLAIYSSFYAKERITSLKFRDNETYDEKNRRFESEENQLEILNKAKKVYSEYINSETGNNHLQRDSFDFLVSCVESSEELETGLYELLNQTTVLTWSTFEVFVSDFSKEFVNNNPHQLEKLSKVNSS